MVVYNDTDTSQIFSATEIEKILNCSYTTAKEIMKKIRDIEVMVEVKGNGKICVMKFGKIIGYVMIHSFARKSIAVFKIL